MKNHKSISSDQQEALLAVLKERFERFQERHKGLEWSPIQKRILENKDKSLSLFDMEETGGEPDVVDYDPSTDTYIFMDCSPESPKGRRSLCYDNEALDSRKEHKPEGSALGMAEEMGIEVLTEEQYRKLQKIGEFDQKTSSWVITPDKIRGLGGALFCDRRYDTVFVYHNGAESYYGARGFRGSLLV